MAAGEAAVTETVLADSSEPPGWRASKRELIDAVIRSFEAAALPGDPSWTPEELGFVVEVRDAFIAAGAARVERELNPDAWLQLGIHFGSAGPDACEKFLAGDLAAAVRAWRARGTLDRFFFMRKPPGLRLRFRGKNLGETLLPALLDFLEGARKSGGIGGHEFGVYDAETHQFGGELGLDIAHEWFTADSLAALAVLALERTGQETNGREALSLFALNDLVSRVAPDPWEQWDVWSNLRLTGRLPILTPSVRTELLEELDKNRTGLTRSLWHREELLASLSAPERAILIDVCAANERVASRFREAARQRALAYGPRKILPFLMVFHWNRWGFDPALQMALAFFMEELLNPKGT
jgi:thiopeptide-type bacteriocin biosynthesis protein